MASTHIVWHKLLEPGELAEGRVVTRTVGTQTLCVTHFEGEFAALSNRCPHQGGPLGEGSIEKGLLRCPWHGWDYHPTTGQPPDGYGDCVPTHPVEVRSDGIYVALEQEASHVETVSDVVVRTLANWDVRNVFGMVGHSNLGLADAIRRHARRGQLRYFGIRHEGAAAFACSAYGKLTGRPAACLSIAGPGATNLLTGLWDANVDRSPVIALTGQVDAQVLGSGAFQEIDLASAFGGVAVWTQPVLHTSRHAELANLACKNAIVERGVSHLIFPDEVQTLVAPDDARPGSPQGRLASDRIAPPRTSVDAAVATLAQASRPAIIVGHGARFDMDAITGFAEAIGCPVITTFKAKGQVRDDHDLGCGVLGRSGTPIASHFMNEADVLLVLGASFSNHTGITPKKPTIQVDRDRVTLGKFHAIDVPVWGEIAATVAQLHERVGQMGSFTDQRSEIGERWRIWRAEKARRREDDRGLGLDAATIFDALSRRAPANAIMPVDVGNNTYSFGRYFECVGQTILMSGYLGSIGFAFPAAMGAWAATQEPGSGLEGRPVVSVSGDGGFGQYMVELLTAVKYDMDLTHVLIRNDELGKITKEQRAGEWEVWETSLHNPSFAKYADLCGARGFEVRAEEDLDDAIEEAFAHTGPSLVEIFADPALV